MIRPLRRRHRLLVTGLAVLLPPAFVLALAVRPPPAPEAPPALWPKEEHEPLRCARAFAEGGWSGLPLLARLGHPGDGSALWVELRATAPIRLPDLLLYWRPDEGGEGLEGAVLLAPFAGARTARLPEQARGGGALVLYSLARGQIVGAAPLPSPAETIPCP